MPQWSLRCWLTSCRELSTCRSRPSCWRFCFYFCAVLPLGVCSHVPVYVCMAWLFRTVWGAFGLNILYIIDSINRIDFQTWWFCAVHKLGIPLTAMSWTLLSLGGSVSHLGVPAPCSDLVTRWGFSIHWFCFLCHGIHFFGSQWTDSEPSPVQIMDSRFGLLDCVLGCKIIHHYCRGGDFSVCPDQLSFFRTVLRSPLSPLLLYRLRSD